MGEAGKKFILFPLYYYSLLSELEGKLPRLKDNVLRGEEGRRENSTLPSLEVSQTFIVEAIFAVLLHLFFFAFVIYCWFPLKDIRLPILCKKDGFGCLAHILFGRNFGCVRVNVVFLAIKRNFAEQTFWILESLGMIERHQLKIKWRHSSLGGKDECKVGMNECMWRDKFHF